MIASSLDFIKSWSSDKREHLDSTRNNNGLARRRVWPRIFQRVSISPAGAESGTAALVIMSYTSPCKRELAAQPVWLKD